MVKFASKVKFIFRKLRGAIGGLSVCISMSHGKFKNISLIVDFVAFTLQVLTDDREVINDMKITFESNAKNMIGYY